MKLTSSLSSTSTRCSLKSRQPRLRPPSVRPPGRQSTSQQLSPEQLMVLRPPGGQPCRSVCPSFPHTQCALVKQPSLTCLSLQNTQLSSQWVKCSQQDVPVVQTSLVDFHSVTS